MEQIKKQKRKRTGDKVDNKMRKHEEDETDKDLETFLFGTVNEDGNDKVVELTAEKCDEETILPFVISTNPDEELSLPDDIDNENFGTRSKEKKEEEKEKEQGDEYWSEELKERAPAWVDPDDEQISIAINVNKKKKLKVRKKEREVTGDVFQKRLKTQFEKILPTPAWAEITDEGDVDKGYEKDGLDEDDLLKSTKDLLETNGRLPKSILNIGREKNINKQDPASSAVTSLEFHPSAKVAFTSSLNQRLNIFQTDGKENQKLQSIYLEGFPIYTAHFGNHGDKIYMASRRQYFYVFDIQAGGVQKVRTIRDGKDLYKFEVSPDNEWMAFLGLDGYINMVSSMNCQFVHNLKVNGIVDAVCFSHDSKTLYATGTDGEVYIWDLRTRRCRNRFVDDGSYRSTSISCSPNGKFLAVGSTSGVVNLYEEQNLNVKIPKPTKSLMNLTTWINGTKFNSKSEILAYFSKDVRNGLKLVHFPSLTTFSNWPIEKQTLGNITSLDFSPLSGYLGIGNDRGKALMFRLHHYPDA